ncbi:MAG: hypothetical protein H0W24_09935 [Lysobacter sp.]|nr:hypothetical protein [Lysobacter sp.]MDQ3268666.1 hypothetical protein [Pseudomonadota bacterium]
MAPGPRKPLDLVLTIVFVLLGVFRLYQYSAGQDVADLLSGIGLLLVAFSSYYGTFLFSSRGTAAPGRAAGYARYAGYAGLALILAAIVMRFLP